MSSMWDWCSWYSVRRDGDEARARRLEEILDEVGDAVRGAAEHEPLSALARQLIELVEDPSGLLQACREAEYATEYELARKDDLE